jgi:spore maturation protein CgeB
MKLLIIGNREGTNVGGCFERAALAAGIETVLIPSNLAMEAPPWLRCLNWHVRGRRPSRLAEFGDQVLRLAGAWGADLLLATGIAPMNRKTLVRLAEQGIGAINYLTDDPWNPAHRAPWFLEALPAYQVVFSPRRSNLADLVRAGCRAVKYVPFGYDPALHWSLSAAAVETAALDLVFIGAAAADRLPYCRALLRAGFRIGLCGDYWLRYSDLKDFWRGYADPAMSRRWASQAKINLCLVRRANRDGHTMRSFEAAASGGCLLVEFTAEHWEIFGPDGDAVCYFRDVPEMVSRAEWLVANAPERARLAGRVQRRITRGGNTYAHRLRTMLEQADFASALRMDP